MEFVVDYKNLDLNRERFKEQFSNATPFKYLVIDNLLHSNIALEMNKEIEGEDQEISWIRHKTYNQDLYGLSEIKKYKKFTELVYKDLVSSRFMEFLRFITSDSILIPDYTLYGGGVRKAFRGGHLNLHVDFLNHTVNKKLRRKLNLIFYLNTNWKPEYGGDLELWDPNCEYMAHKIAPLFNRCVLFETTSSSYHGFPDKLKCPEGMTRNSFAIYYYNEINKELKIETSHYRARPQDKLTEHLFVNASNKLQKIYSFMIRNSLISHNFTNKIINLFFKR